MRKISNARSSRRAPALKDSDYDHEINLVDHVAEAATPQPLSPEPAEQTDQADHALSTSQTAETTLGPQPGSSSPRRDRSRSRSTVTTRHSASSASASTRSKKSKSSRQKSSQRRGSKSRVDIPRVELQEPTPLNKPNSTTPPASPRSRASPETDIDVLYENQRGGLLCGIRLFSPRALGQLDPPAWTNIAHKPSPTNIHTAQVPDPSWAWAWPEWRVNRDVGVDEEGWEYSFMFARAFSWHQPKWYNSFVRRRAWIRKRARRGAEGANDPHMLNTEYFTVRPSVDTTRTGSKASSRRSRASMMSISSGGGAGEKADVEDVATLMAVLSWSRIDREKIEAVESFLAHGEEELAHLQHRMHDIMAFFVFQASRRVLLSKLNEVFEETKRELAENDTGRLQRRSNNLKAAIRHADEECRRLEYWSDLKKLVKEGGTKTAADKCEGWAEGWRGVDSSGPGVPDASKCNI